MLCNDLCVKHQLDVWILFYEIIWSKFQNEIMSEDWLFLLNLNQLIL